MEGSSLDTGERRLRGGDGPGQDQADRSTNPNQGSGPRGGAARGGSGGGAGEQTPLPGTGYATVSPGRAGRGSYQKVDDYRDLPDPTGSRTRYVDTAPTLRRAAESAIARERVPPPYATRVRRYFENVEAPPP